jgi:predicted MFS family arabinose efflux permease
VSAEADLADPSARVGPGRWAALGAFALLVVTTQLMWLSFASITDQTGQALGVSEGAVGDLAVINPAMFVILAIPAGRWMDRHYGRALGTGAVLTAAGALLRTVDVHSYAWIFAGQAVLSVGQPLVLNATTKIAARYFPPRERTNAIAIASGAQFVGIFIAVLLSGVLFNAGGLRLVTGIYAGVAVVAAVAVLASFAVKPSFVTEASAGGSLAWLRNDRLIWRLAGLLFVGFGVYNALATWLDSIMTSFGHSNTAGGIIAVTTAAGVVGAAILPVVAAARNARRAVCILTTVVLASALLLITAVHTVAAVVIALALVGFTLLGNLPVVLDWSELEVGPERASTTTGLLLLVGNLGGVIVVLTVQIVIGHPTAALAVMAAWAIPGLLLALGLPRRAGTHHRAAPAEGVAG